MEDHLESAKNIIRETCKNTPSAIGSYGAFIVNYREFLAIHYRLARAVQPTGTKIKPISPIAGAIVTKDPIRSGMATRLLDQKVSRLLDKKDLTGAKKIQALSKQPVEIHRNYNVWVLLNEMIDEQNNQLEQSDSRKAAEIYHIPTKADFKRWVKGKNNGSRFYEFQRLEEQGWDRVWKKSGIEVAEEAYRMLAEAAGTSLDVPEVKNFFKKLSEVPEEHRFKTSILDRGGRGKAPYDR